MPFGGGQGKTRKNAAKHAEAALSGQPGRIAIRAAALHNAVQPASRQYGSELMLTRRTIMTGAVCAAVAPPAHAADSSARAFVAAIYKAYQGSGGNGVALDNDQTVQRYFEPSLAAAIRKDQTDAEQRNEPPVLDFDPFVDAQDWDIATVDIDVRDAAPNKASATVKFTNADKPTTILLDLVRINGEWKVHDITWSRDGDTSTLRGLFTP
jgi:hypothetical protein